MGTGTWSYAAASNYPRTGPTLSAANGKLYIIGGGYGVAGNFTTDYIEEYDPVANKWTVVYTMSHFILNGGSAVINGKIYVVGGKTYAADTSSYNTNDLVAYDPTAKTLAYKASIPGTAKRYVCCEAINGLLYAVGGVSDVGGNEVGTNTLYVYNPTSDTWSQKASVPGAATYDFSTGVINGKLYAYSGAQQLLYVYDPTTNVWTSLGGIPSSPAGSSSFYSSGVVFKNRFYLFFGQVVFEYDPTTGVWRSKTPPPQISPSNSTATAVLNGTLYLSGDSYQTAVIPKTSNIDDYTPDAPVVTYPTNNSTVTTGTPVFQGAAPSWSTPTKIEYEVSSTSDFSSVTDYTEPDTAYRSSGNYSLAIPSATKLSQQLWYLRARAVSTEGIEGAWSSTYSFTVSHKPSAINLRPTNSGGVLYSAPKLTWQFSDTSATDTQSARQVVIERNDNGLLVVDTGKIASSDQFYVPALTSDLKNVVLRWKLQVWDSEDKTAGFTPYNLFQATDAPTVDIISPLDGAIVTTGTPEIDWQFSAPAGRQQNSYSVSISKVGNVNSVYSTGTLLGSNSSNRPTVPILSTGTSYTATVTVTDSLGLSAADTITFQAVYEEPDEVTFSADSSLYESDGYVSISWQSVSDSSFILWRVYRRVVGDFAYTVIGEISEVNVTEFKDWLVPSMNTYEYLVVQVVDRFGEAIESSISSTVVVTLDTGGYWLIDTVDPSNNIRLYNVTDETYTDNHEQAEYTIIGRGRHVDEGEKIGKSGSMTAKLRATHGTSARAKKVALEALRSRGIPVYLRNPFGDINYVSIGDIGVTRIAGTGSNEFVDVTIPYLEVF